MKKHIIPLYIAAAVLLAVTGCTDEQLPGTAVSNIAFTPKGELVDAYLNLSVSGLSVIASTRTPSEDTEAERVINDIWVFQYDAASDDDDSRELIAPPYYLTIDDQSILAGLPVKLSNNDGEESIIYVVANTGNDTWAKDASGVYTGFKSLKSLKENTIPNPAPIRMSSDDYEDDDTIEEADLSIPMSGSSDKTKVSEGNTISIEVQRMFAKLEIYVTLNTNELYTSATMTSLTIDNILNACSVTTITDADGNWEKPENSKFEVARTFSDLNEDEGEEKEYGPFTIYVPENLSKDEADAIKIIPYIKAFEKDYNAEILSRPYYTAYPGSWSGDAQIDDEKGTGNDHNICRNCVYVISLQVNFEDQPVTASANCLIATPGQTIAFYPYVRDEEMSPELSEEAESDPDIMERYTFTTYLNSSYEGEAANDGKKIKSVKIVWQTQDCIGDNESNKLVWIDDAPSDDPDDYPDMTDEEIATAKTYVEYRRKIYVTTDKAGNALIAAYNGENGNGDILWSWHIWVPEEGVDPEAGAIEYYHYAWDATNGIDTDNFIPGRLVMNLNLGAVKEYPETDDIDTDTYGMTYQWGRKDPFLPARFKPSTPGKVGSGTSFPKYSFYYDGEYPNGFRTIGAYDNADNFIDMTGNDGSIDCSLEHPNEFLFDTNAPNNAGIGGDFGDKDNTIILNSVKHPTTFIAAAAAFTSEGNGTNGAKDYSGSYKNQGDWLPEKDDFLWGGGHPNGKAYQVSSSAYLEDDYGPNKTIFDPCPYGWRVTPGDLWLGFTKTGKNTSYNGSNWDSFNTSNDINTTLYQGGWTMYMQGWHSGNTTYFPDQGTRLVSGQPFATNVCGNYHNATTDPEVTQDGYTYRKVEILHFHIGNTNSGGSWIYPFNSGAYYNSKAIAGPLRCVRE